MTNQTTLQNKSTPQTGFPANFLKIFAALTMLIDHIAVTLVYANLAKEPGYWNILTSEDSNEWMISLVPDNYKNLCSIYFILRRVGRIAFPLFAFLLVEGFIHTSNYKRYLTRVGICALAAEIPFNLVVTTASGLYTNLDGVKTSIFCWQYQNTVFTFFIGLLMLLGMRYFEAKDATPKAAFRQMLGQIACVVVAGLVSVLLRTDYNFFGILAIAVFYIFRHSKKMMILLGCLVFLQYDIACLMAFIPIYMYNGIEVPARKLKYFFYIFYPAHLLVLFLASLFI